MTETPDASEYERLATPWRARAKPICVLLIGESPPYPKAGRIHYFYGEDDENPGLASSIAHLFGADASGTGWKRRFLDRFSRHHFALIDLVEKPFRKDERESLVAGSLPTLGARVAVLNPTWAVILLPKLASRINPLLSGMCRIPKTRVKFPTYDGGATLRLALAETASLRIAPDA